MGNKKIKRERRVSFKQFYEYLQISSDYTIASIIDKLADIQDENDVVKDIQSGSIFNLSEDQYYALKFAYDSTSDSEYLDIWAGIFSVNDSEYKKIVKKLRPTKTALAIGADIYITVDPTSYDEIDRFYTKFCHIVRMPKGAPVNTWLNGKFAVTSSGLMLSTGGTMLTAFERDVYDKLNSDGSNIANLVFRKKVQKSDILIPKENDAFQYDFIGDAFIVDSAIFILALDYISDAASMITSGAIKHPALTRIIQVASTMSVS